MAVSRTMKLSGWGNLPATTNNVWRPEHASDLAKIFPSVRLSSVIARGQGRSYGDSAVNDSAHVAITEHLNRLIDFDSETGQLTCEAGVRFDDLIETFVPRGFFLSVTPGTKYVSVGGAIAADVHGKNHHVDGSIGNYVEQLELLLADGRKLTCSRQQHSDLFWATIGGMGLTGLITQVTLRMRPVQSAFIKTDYTQLPNLNAALDLLSDPDRSPAYSVAWIDCLAKGDSLGRSVLIEGQHANVSDLPSKIRSNPYALGTSRKKSVPFHFPSLVLNSWSIKAFNALYYWKHKTKLDQIVHYDSFFYPLDSINHWNRIYGKRGFIQYQALLPTETSRHGMEALLKSISASKMASFLAVLKKTGQATEGLMSFCKPGFTLALDLPNYGTRLQKLISELDAITLDHGGRLYLAKDAMTTPEMIQATYPNLDTFRTICKQLDPDGIFQSTQSRRLKLLAD